MKMLFLVDEFFLGIWRWEGEIGHLIMFVSFGPQF